MSSHVKSSSRGSTKEVGATSKRSDSKDEGMGLAGVLVLPLRAGVVAMRICVSKVVAGVKADRRSGDVVSIAKLFNILL